MNVLTWLVDNQRPSAARFFRARRFRFFRSLLDRLPRPVRILDVGGTDVFWRMMGFARESGVEITTISIDVMPSTSPQVTALYGDARDLSRFADRSFDVVFSNSLIEHVGGLEDQQRVAREVQRVGKAFFVQTPNRNFPLEPHFVFPFFQHLSVPARVYLLTHFNLGWCGKIADPEEARRIAVSVQLLDRHTLRNLFPSALIWEERVLGLVKSFVAYGGFPPARRGVTPAALS